MFNVSLEFLLPHAFFSSGISYSLVQKTHYYSFCILSLSTNKLKWDFFVKKNLFSQIFGFLI